VEAAADQFGECDPAVLRDGGEADMDFAVLVFECGCIGRPERAEGSRNKRMGVVTSAVLSSRR
jgi:hypothetical protein